MARILEDQDTSFSTVRTLRNCFSVGAGRAGYAAGPGMGPGARELFGVKSGDSAFVGRLLLFSSRRNTQEGVLPGRARPALHRLLKFVVLPMAACCSSRLGARTLRRVVVLASGRTGTILGHLRWPE